MAFARFATFVLALALPTAAQADDFAELERAALAGEDGVEPGGLLDSHVAGATPALQVTVDPMTEDLFQLRSEWLEEIEGLAPGARIVGGGVVGLLGLAALVGSIAGFVDGHYGPRALGGLALLSGVMAAAGLTLFEKGIKEGRRRRHLRRRLRRLRLPEPTR